MIVSLLSDATCFKLLHTGDLSNAELAEILGLKWSGSTGLAGTLFYNMQAKLELVRISADVVAVDNEASLTLDAVQGELDVAELGPDGRLHPDDMIQGGQLPLNLDK